MIRHENRQVTELPPIRLEVTEHQIEVKNCPKCGRIAKADFPVNVTSPTQYGTRLKVLGVYLNQYQLLPYNRVCELFEDLFNQTPCESTLVNTNDLLFEKLESVEKEIVMQIIQQDVVHFDESGMRVEGKNSWCHTASTDKLTHFSVHKKRGKEGMDAAGILPHFQNTAIHDSWGSYFMYIDCLHALCNAHILRELIFVLEQEKQMWAKDMIELLLDVKKAVEQVQNNGEMLSMENMIHYAERYDVILTRGFEEDALFHPQASLKQMPLGKRGKVKQSKPKNLLDRLSNHRISVLAFMADPKIPFDNNQVERDQRMNKVRQKISGTFRSVKGAETYCRIRGYISTAKKNAVSVLEALYDAIQERPFTPTP